VVYTQKLLKEVFDPKIQQTMDSEGVTPMMAFQKQLRIRLERSAMDPDVVGFKSVVCYRTGLDVQVQPYLDLCVGAFAELFSVYQQSGKIRIAHKPLNDYVVTMALEVAAEYKKPGR